MLSQLQHQATLDEAALQAEFEGNHAWMMAWTVDDLVVIN